MLDFIYSLFGSLFDSSETQELHRGRCGVNETAMRELIIERMKEAGITEDSGVQNNWHQNSDESIAISGEVENSDQE